MSDYQDENVDQVGATEAGVEQVGTEETAAAAEAQPAFDFSSPEFREAVGEASREQLAELLEQAARYEQQQPPEGDEDGEFDPYGDPTGFRENLNGMIENAVRQVIGPMVPTVQAFEDQQNEARIGEWCDHIPAIKEAQGLLGEDHKDDAAGTAVRFMASGYLPDLEARYGPGERAVQSALRMAADQYKADIDAAHKAGYQARNAELQGLTGAPRPAPHQAAEAVGLSAEPEDEMAAVNVWLARNGRE